MKKILLYSMLTFLSLALTSCIETSKWTAFVYPDMNNIPKAGEVQHYIIGEFNTFEQCQSAAIGKLKYIYETTGKYGDFECGYKCSIRDEYGGLFMCKEDRK